MRAARMLVTLLLAVPFPASSLPLASCGGSAPTISGSATAPVILLSGICSDHFSLRTRASLVLVLDPDQGFTGTLTGTLRGREGHNVKALYATGALLLGASTGAFSLPAGAWELEVRAGGEPPPCTVIPPPPGVPGCPLPGAAAGSFAGSVTAS